ncbi:MAG: hypothetical protein HC869_07310 [Rhodospirillales bacterium]|nr:hypothetical protein [Rhodospirillales bacterium]
MTLDTHNDKQVQASVAMSGGASLQPASVSEAPRELDETSVAGIALARHVRRQAALAVFGIAALAFWAKTYVPPIEMRTALSLHSVYDDTARDTAKQYRIASRAGDKIQLCVYARMISTAYQHAKNESAYRAWEAQERADCAAAGMGASRTPH